MRKSFLLISSILALLLFSAPAQAASCSDYANQAEAQEAADTIDADGDGVYCESLPCPCSTQADEDGESKECSKPKKTQKLYFSKDKYPNIYKHYRSAVKRGWGRLLVVNRGEADARRDRLLSGYPTREGYDRDEYPPAVGRGSTFPWLMRGSDPTGWKASVRYVPSSENRSHGSVMGALLRDFCDGTRFRYRFTG